LDGRSDHGECRGDGVYFHGVQGIERSAAGRIVTVR
jgi:hypothetical protein